jgi:hypothetical protein
MVKSAMQEMIHLSNFRKIVETKLANYKNYLEESPMDDNFDLSFSIFLWKSWLKCIEEILLERKPFNNDPIFVELTPLKVIVILHLREPKESQHSQQNTFGVYNQENNEIEIFLYKIYEKTHTSDTPPLTNKKSIMHFLNTNKECITTFIHEIQHCQDYKLKHRKGYSIDVDNVNDYDYENNPTEFNALSLQNLFLTCFYGDFSNKMKKANSIEQKKQLINDHLTKMSKSVKKDTVDDITNDRLKRHLSRLYKFLVYIYIEGNDKILNDLSIKDENKKDGLIKRLWNMFINTK